jgi:uncharacterized protein GlcG (DUF336 family)
MSKLISSHSLSLKTAKKLIDDAVIKATELGVGGAIAVVDSGGHLICVERIDNTMIAAANIAIGKAATAVGFKRSGMLLEQTVTKDRVAMQTLISITPAPFVPLMGAYPIIYEDEIIGGIAVAGAENGQNDETIVLYAINEYKKLKN